MKLYKAVKDKDMKQLNSVFNKSYKAENLHHTLATSWHDILIQTLSHISQGDRKLEGDYWISATKDIRIAQKYLSKDGYVGIVEIDLQNTKSGYIYDESLRESGFIETNFEKGKQKVIWNPNKDGIVVALDFSSPYTHMYVQSYLAMQGTTHTAKNLRSIRNSFKDNEVLLMGMDISFKFIGKEDIDNIDFKLLNCEENMYTDYYFELYKMITKEPSEAALSYKHFYDNIIYYDNLTRRNEEYFKFSYSDKDIIDFEKYDVLKKDFEKQAKDFLAAFWEELFKSIRRPNLISKNEILPYNKVEVEVALLAQVSNPSADYFVWIYFFSTVNLYLNELTFRKNESYRSPINEMIKRMSQAKYNPDLMGLIFLEMLECLDGGNSKFIEKFKESWKNSGKRLLHNQLKEKEMNRIEKSTDYFFD